MKAITFPKAERINFSKSWDHYCGLCVMFPFFYIHIFWLLSFRIVSSVNFAFSFNIPTFFYLLVNTIFEKILNTSCLMDKTSRNFLWTQQNVAGFKCKDYCVLHINQKYISGVSGPIITVTVESVNFSKSWVCLLLKALTSWLWRNS